MRLAAIAATLVLALAGCANEYSDVPEPKGDWIAANPPSLTAAPMPVEVPPLRHSRWMARQARR
jgi:hypothetical protein